METPSLSHRMNSAVTNSAVSNHKVLFPVLTAFLETTLNHLLYRETVLKPARLRLVGKTLSIKLKEIETPLVLIFSEQQVDVLSQWAESADCSMKTTIPALLKLRDRQCLSALINNGEIVIEGDMQVIQQWSALLDMSEWDPAYYLSPYVGDIVAEGISRMMKKGLNFANNTIARKKTYFTESLTEEWKMVPNALEVAYFSEEVDAVANKIIQIEKRLAALEGKQ
ncbi:SCP2 domain-containing protein [Xenorhabdus sp. Reich]|uniref:Ubiquinone biosynthesis accessory factor UbiJ n=1 Tax=Xenorhabdus littoralis TaxID=2582835 RepID=A0ABU4SP74_9GAMM|nr:MULTISPECIES: SCP2 domain-containing protein [unclassified Xenorhabdus]MDX7990899.1 SCP2 domain-containing protein [Xenorhabdus sp. psl]MDX8000439.1 SCP2 domain-containing protein [Xenorhabdus sp. Reich]